MQGTKSEWPTGWRPSFKYDRRVRPESRCLRDSYDGMLFPGHSTSDSEVGWVLPVLDSASLGYVAGNRDKITTVDDDDFDKVVRKKWRRPLLALACNGENTTLRILGSRYW